MWRSDPFLLTPPAASRAYEIVESPLTKYEPGCSASPNTNTRMERSFPMVMDAVTPIDFLCRCSAISALAWPKLQPAKVNDPTFGNPMTPLRSITCLLYTSDAADES